MAVESRPFQAEVSRLLDIVAHSLYSDRDIFLRELISNASDACDRLRYRSLTEPGLAGPAAHRIVISPDAAARTLTIEDTGDGMDEAELAENLGTIARSGTARFLEQMKARAESAGADTGGKADSGGKADLSLIGQFGVGFYSAFMVADTVTVTSRKAGGDQAFTWESDGRTGYTIAPGQRDAAGTTICLHLREDAGDYTSPDRLRAIVRKYSDHIALPIVLKDGDTEDTLNSASALWSRSKSEVTPEQTLQFYRHLAPGVDEPFATVHVRAEGALEYSSLLFVPGAKPFDLFNPDRRHGVKLYVRRVFITEGVEGLIPGYLRFVKGVVDSSDLPLNVSREMLQNNPLLSKIRSNLVKKVLAELDKKSSDDGYNTFWDNFGAVLKEGLYEDFENRDLLFKLARFRSSTAEGLITLDSYIERMKPGQAAIYTISGESAEALLASPQLEGFKAKGVEVLLLTDPIDEFWMPSVGSYKDKPFRSVTRSGDDLAKIEGGPAEPADPAAEGEVAKLVALFKLTLGDEVKDVRTSVRLTDSAVCLAADAGDMDMRLEKLLRQHRQIDSAAKRVLEVNPRHPLIRGLAQQIGKGDDDSLGEAAKLLLDQARIIEGEPLPDPAGFARRLAAALARGLPGPGPANLAA